MVTKEQRERGRVATEAAEAAVATAKQLRTREAIVAARKAIDAIPCSVGFEVDAICLHEELDEI
jgi:hypothetical protein